MEKTLELLLNGVISGIGIGSIYALIALGYTMVYGIAKMINFAHGDVIMVGAYIMYYTTVVLHLPVAASILLTVAGCLLLGVTIEKVAYKPLRNATPLAVLITAIGVSFFLQSMALLITKGVKKQCPPVINLAAFNITIGNVMIPGKHVITLIVTIICMILLTLFVNKTKMGSAMRAVSEDKGAASLMGINVNRTVSITFAIGSALAGVASILYLFTSFSIDSTYGALPGIKAFIAAVLGGIGSIPGAMLGGILLGLIESLAKLLPGEASTLLVDAIVFGILILVLLMKPSGLLGKQRIEKV